VNRKLLSLVFSIPLIFISGCPIYYSTYDAHYLYYQNKSSRDIFIQYFLDGNWYSYDGLEGDVYLLTLDSLPKSTEYEQIIGSSDYDPIKKVLIFDINSRKLLRKIINWDSFFNTLPVEKWEEKSAHETVTNYRHSFLITDDFFDTE
jgi:hypothetical protein